MQSKVTTNAPWKAVYEEMFRNAPKKKRRTKYQIKMMRGQAKIMIELYQ
jgi:hypothetical protein